MSGPVVVDFDPAVWLLPPQDPDTDLEAWALNTAADCYAETGVEPDERQITMLATALLGLGVYAQDAGGMCFVHPRPPELGPRGLVVLTAYDGGDGSPQALRELVRADADDLAEPATVDAFQTSLGAALRARRYAYAQGPADPPGALVASLTYAWHLPGEDTDLVLVSPSLNLADLVEVEPDLDDLARAVGVG